MAKRLTRYLAVFWDRSAARNLQMEADRDFEKIAESGSKEFQETMARGGKDAARALTRTLQQEYRLRMARARLAMAEGTIDEKAFEKEGRDAAEAFNRGLTGGIRKLRAQGNTDELALLGLTGRFRRVPGDTGRAGILGGLALGGFAGPLAGIISVSSAISGSRGAIATADQFEASVRKLGGTSRLTGVDLQFLEDTSERAGEAFKLAMPLANDLTSEVVKLTERAGDITQTSQAIESFLNIGAARGLTAAETLQAISQAVLGIDEGTDKLFGKNPSTLYAEYAQKIGTTAGALSDQQKAQALLDATLAGGERTRGEYASYLESSRGLAEQAANAQQEHAAQMGRSLQPMRELANQLKTDLLASLSELVEVAAKPIEITVRFITTGTGALARYLRWTSDLEERMNRFYARIGLHPKAEDEVGVVARVGEVSSLGLPGGPANENEALRQRRLDAPEIPRPLAPIDEKAEEARRRRIQAMWQRISTPEPIPLGDMPTPEDLQAQRAAWFTDLGGSLERVGSGTAEQRRQMLDDLQRDMEDRFQRIQDVSSEAAYQMASAFQDAFQLMAKDGATIENLFEGIGRGMAGSLLSGLAQFAEGKAAENIAAAVEAAAYALGYTSHGNFPSASAAWAAAAQHTAAATAWAALAGGAGAGRAGITGGGGAIPPSTRDVGLDTARAAVQDPAPIIIEIDPFDPGNPIHAKAVGEGMDLNVRLGGVPAWAGVRR